jgi:hypothetical protein
VADLDATRQAIAEEYTRRSSESAALIAQSEREVTEAEDALTRIRADYMRGAITAEHWQSFQAQLTEAREPAARKLWSTSAHVRTRSSRPSMRRLQLASPRFVKWLPERSRVRKGWR